MFRVLVASINNIRWRSSMKYTHIKSDEYKTDYTNETNYFNRSNQLKYTFTSSFSEKYRYLINNMFLNIINKFFTTL